MLRECCCGAARFGGSAAAARHGGACGTHPGRRGAQVAAGVGAQRVDRGQPYHRGLVKPDVHVEVIRWVGRHWRGAAAEEQGGRRAAGRCGAGVGAHMERCINVAMLHADPALLKPRCPAQAPQAPSPQSSTKPAAQSRQLLLAAAAPVHRVTQSLSVQPDVQLNERSPGQSRTLPLTHIPVARGCQSCSVRPVVATREYSSQVGASK